jgi:alpha-tubulin suppressor-like RCC1 family protein
VPLNFAAVRGGTGSACAITDSGAALCWGNNWYGVVGNGSFLDATVPVFVAGGIAFKSLATGDDHACGVAVDGKGYCWGHDGPGMLGNGKISDVLTPEVVLGGPYTAVASGQHHVCALKASGAVNCAGRNINLSVGQSAATVVQTTPSPILGSTVFQTLSTRNTFANCGLATVASGTNLFCWGGNHLGAVGNNTTTDQASPVVVQGGTRTYTAVASGGDQNQPASGSQFTCALASVASGAVNNNLWCWGLNTLNVNQLAGANISTLRTAPFQSTFPNAFFTKISLGSNFGCALTTAGAAFCWGGNASGQLGRGVTSTGASPGPVSGGRFFSSIAAGQNSACAVELVTQDLYCWGANGAGQLGTGVPGTQTTPQLVSGGHDWIRVAVGNAWACGITTSNDMYCWGDNGRGQLGMGDHLDRNVPAPVSTSVKFATVNANFISTCGLATDGQAYCWGHKGFGRLGGGKIAYSNTPQLIVGGLGF